MENQNNPFETRNSSILLGGFFVTIILILYIWWPLAEEVLSYVDWKGPWWLYMDWLLFGIFGFMSITIMARANLKTDVLIVFVGICGGLAIESWGTQTNLWHYYTAERPPLWIIPAWPIASLSIDRISRFLNWTIDQEGQTNQANCTHSSLLCSLLDDLRFFLNPDAGLCFPDIRQVLYMAGVDIVYSAHRHANGSSLCPVDIYRRRGTWLLP